MLIRNFETSRLKRRATISAVAIAGALAALPAAAGAANLVIPQTATQTVTPHVANVPAPSAPTAPPAYSPPAPSYSHSSTSSGSTPASQAPPQNSGGGHGDSTIEESGMPAADVPPIPGDHPFPEGLPDAWDSACDLGCKQEWFAWYNDRQRTVYYASLDGKASKVAVKLLEAQGNAVEAAIEKAGGDPDELDRVPDGGREWLSTQPSPASGPSGGSAPSLASSPKSSSDDTGTEGPEEGWALGEFDGSGLVDDLMFASGGVLVKAAVDAFTGGSPSGTTTCGLAKATADDPATCAM